MPQSTISTLTPDVSDEQLLTTGELALILRCERSKAQRLLAEGTIEGGVRVGSRFLISAGALRAWLKAEQLPKNREIYNLRQTLRSKRQ